MQVVEMNSRKPAAPAIGQQADRLWRAVLARDASADGHFVYAVSTTGIYCRPTCPSRRPRPANVSFHTSPAAAEQAGFRPCRRCRPDQAGLDARHRALVQRACRTIEHAESPPSLSQLARGAALSPYHFHRVFKSVTGVTPREYAQAQRSRRARDGLARGESVTATMFDAGFNSSGRFYEAADGMLGMKPSDYRAGGAEQEIEYATGHSAMGVVLVARSARGLCAILLGDDATQLSGDLARRFPRARLAPAGGTFSRVVEAVVRFVEQPARGLELPLDIRGTAFQQRVWQALQKIPVGSTCSYAEVARRLGIPSAARAVAAACAANPLAVAVPCHRVVRGDGDLAGYRWGVDRKRELLTRESRSRKRATTRAGSRQT